MYHTSSISHGGTYMHVCITHLVSHGGTYSMYKSITYVQGGTYVQGCVFSCMLMRTVWQCAAACWQDWGWFYPFHYAPCASDLINLAQFAGAPLLPLTQIWQPFRSLPDMASMPPLPATLAPTSRYGNHASSSGRLSSEFPDAMQAPQ